MLLKDFFKKIYFVYVFTIKRIYKMVNTSQKQLIITTCSFKLCIKSKYYYLTQLNQVYYILNYFFIIYYF